jgi:methyl-accepting chemotaxis protein
LKHILAKRYKERVVIKKVFRNQTGLLVVLSLVVFLIGTMLVGLGLVPFIGILIQLIGVFGLLIITRGSFLPRATGIVSSQDQNPNLPNQHKHILLEFKTSVMEAEDAGRRMASQVGNTSAFVSQITSTTDGISKLSDATEDKVVSGAAAMEEINATIEQLTHQIQQQGLLVHESASAIEQMTASIASVRATVENRQQVVQSLNNSTVTGHSRIQTTQKVISDVSQSVSSVRSMIDVIDDIAARTNLLAMNAAIEAAHAGASGKGFAVVAQEIRKLAVSTAENASNISQTLNNLVKKIHEAELSSKDIGEAFAGIAKNSSQVQEAFLEIFASTKELDAGAQDMLESTGNLSRITNSITGGASEMRLASKEITDTLVIASEMVQNTNSGVKQISKTAEQLNTATGKITDLNILVNKSIQEQLEMLLKHQEDPSMAQSQQRLEISTLILTHLRWLSLSREVMAGTISRDDAPPSDPTKSALGLWMAGKGREIIGDSKVYSRLDSLHKSLHQQTNQIIEGQYTETSFQTLLNTSKEIVEILSSLQIDDSVRWSPAIEVKVELFDQHHKNLLQMIDKLYQALKQDQTHDQLKVIFDDLLDYTGYHFNAEIQAMEFYGYPKCDDHKQMHANLVRNALALRKDLEDGKPMIALEVKEFLRDWIVNHIQKCDKLYSTFFQGKDLNQFFERRADYIAQGKIKARA